MSDRNAADGSIGSLPTRFSSSTSLERKLPALIGLLVLGIVAVLAAFAWLQFRETVRRSAVERLSSVTVQFRDLFQQSVVQLRQRGTEAAAQPALAAYASDRSAAATRAALAALQNVTVAPEQVVATELRDSSGRLLLTTAPGQASPAEGTLPDVIPSTEPGGEATIGNFRLLRDTLVYPVAAPVRGRPDLYVVRWRRMTGSRRTRELLTRLVGSDASIYIGNARGEGWSDLERPVARPDFAADSASGVRDYERDGERHLVSAMAIPGSPWTVAVGFPRDTVDAPVAAFLRRIALIAAIALLAGLLVAWRMSRRITTPLVELTSAAEGIAGGSYGTQVTVQSNDELGRLASSFSRMSAEVQRSRDHLEDQVRERTRELNDALRQLHETQDALVRRERLAMLGQLSSGVGHELRNPLGVMTNSVYYLKAVLRDAPPKVTEYLDIIQQQISLSEKIVSDLLDFARQKPPQRKATPLRQLIDIQVERLGRRDGVRVDIEVPDELPDVLVDPIQAGQIVFNLLTNAVQALDGSGRVEVHAREQDGRVEIVVSDNGPGVPSENAERIFEPLFTTKARGIGLGLAVSRTLARANGGDLTLYQSGGVGATFILALEPAVAVASRAVQRATVMEEA